MKTQILTHSITLYISTYHNYNSGNLNGLHVEFSADSDESDILDQIKQVIPDEDPEYMVQDWDFSSDSLRAIFEAVADTSESLDIQGIIDFLGEIENFDYDLEILAAYSKNFSSGNDLDSLISGCNDAYSGSFNSDEDFAEDFAEQCGYMTESKGWPFWHIDWTAAARELMLDYFEYDGHYFRNN